MVATKSFTCSCTAFQRFATTLAVIALSVCGGCQWNKGGSWKFAHANPVRWFKGEEAKPEPEIPERIVTSWTSTTLTKPGQTPQRGFGGRIVFLGKEKQEEPVRVEGQLVVYAFDETDRPSYETQPTRRYVFPAEQFGLYETSNKLGSSYSVWLPWDDVGGPQKKISLIARFEPKGGSLIVGEQTRHLLPGIEAPAFAAPETLPAATPSLAGLDPRVQPAGYQAGSPASATPPTESTAGAYDAASWLSTTTIGLPRPLATRTARQQDAASGENAVLTAARDARSPAARPSGESPAGNPGSPLSGVATSGSPIAPFGTTQAATALPNSPAQIVQPIVKASAWPGSSVGYQPARPQVPATPSAP